MFVKARSKEGLALGVGKLVRRDGVACTVEYFQAPTAPLVVQQFQAGELELAPLPSQTRVYYFNQQAEAWEIGRILDDHGDSQLIQFPNSKSRHLRVSEVFVRWSQEIGDPTPFLAYKINESPRFSDGRSAFVRAQVAQRAASMGMSALLASAIELEAHQVEVVRRVLQDPVQRYLLADEVGLGKTIEAGVLIRQFVLDAPNEAVVLILAPAPLVRQWRGELSNRFFLDSCLDKSIHIAALGDQTAITRWLRIATMLVIDEAHHLSHTGDGQKIYREIAAAAPAIERVLLLSATPALHNERGFLEMLHLLDPRTYPLEDEEAFRRKVRGRQTIAEMVATLTPQNALHLDYVLDRLGELFPDDALLQEHVQALRSVLDEMPSEGDPVLIDAVAKVHAHLSEVYRLHRRILRHRRRSVSGLTPDRAGVRVIEYRSPNRTNFTTALEDWRFVEASAQGALTDGKSWTQAVQAFWNMLERASEYALTVSLGPPSGALERAVGLGVHFEARLDAVIRALPAMTSDGFQVVLFCSNSVTADAVAAALRGSLGVPVHRHRVDDDEWQQFVEAPGGAVLVCDRQAEEGLNLQGGRKVVVHYDLPLNPNRIEQRLGRTDRYGSGDAVLSVALLCLDDPFDQAWFDYLNAGLRLFERSVAGLQYLIEDATLRLAPAIFANGIEALTELTAASAGPTGLIEREIRALDQQDALDALGAPPTEFFDELTDLDAEWEDIAAATTLWIERTLQFSRVEDASSRTGSAGPFRYLYTTDHPRTLIPLPTLIACCRPALDLSVAARGGRAVRTIPYAFSRRIALNRKSRRNGVALMRYGDPFVAGITEVTQADDRGRTFAMWRYLPGYRANLVADLHFRFDFVVEADIAAAVSVLKARGVGGGASTAAARRRADMALPPFFKTVWLNTELLPICDQDKLDALERPYTPDGVGAAAHDLNLNAQRWRRLSRLDIPELENWPALCAEARKRAEAILQARYDLTERLERADRRAAQVEHGRLGQLRARARVEASSAGDPFADLQLEEALSAALRSGIRSPRIRVDSIGAVFVSGDRGATDAVNGGAT